MIDERVQAAIEIVQRQLERLDAIVDPVPPGQYIKDAEWRPAFAELEQWTTTTGTYLAQRIGPLARRAFVMAGPRTVPAGGKRPLLEAYRMAYGSHLRALLTALRDDPETVPFATPQDQRGRQGPPATRKVFVVYGHNTADLLTVMSMLKERWDLEPVVLGKTVAGKGRHLLQMVEEEGADCTYAVAILSTDDLVQVERQGSTQTYVQARPNVLLELGYFYGTLESV